MAKHRAGDRRIISISVPEELAQRLDKVVGKGKDKGRSATIAKMIEQSLTPKKPVDNTKKGTSNVKVKTGIRVESDTM